MNDTEIKERADEEYNRIIALLDESGVSDRKKQILNPVIINAAWMKVKLDDARAAIKNAQIAISYDNGGGQRGIRENPLFKGYESLWKAYMSGMNKIIESLPAEYAEPVKEEAQAPRSVLELVRDKHRKQA